MNGVVTIKGATLIGLRIIWYTILGILFRKDAGQHILKNPLVINGIIEKVPILDPLIKVYSCV